MILAERRMFAKTIIDSDAFLEMPDSSQLLYFHLAMRADDDGFVNKPKTIMKMCGCKDDDMTLLFMKKFLIPFESGVVVIKHWKIHNYIRKDTYTETKYKEEKALLETDENGAYRISCTGSSRVRDGCVTGTSTQESIGEEIDSVSKGEYISPAAPPKTVRHKYGSEKNVLLTDDEYRKLSERFPEDYEERIENMSVGIAIHGYKYKSHYLAILKWAERDADKSAGKDRSANPFLDILKGAGT